MFFVLQETASENSNGSGQSESNAAAVARHRRDQIAARREAYLRVASPLPQRGGGVGRATAPSSVASYPAGNSNWERVGPGSLEQAAVWRQNSQDLEGLVIEDNPYGGNSGPSGRAARQVTLPVHPPSTSDFRGFSRDGGRQPGASAPSPVPFRGMTPGLASSFSTPRAVSGSGVGPQFGGGSTRSVAFQQQPLQQQQPLSSGPSFTVRSGQPPRTSVNGGGGNADAAASMPAAGGSGRGGSSILDRAAYLNASRSTILANAMSAGRQQQLPGS